MGLGRPDAGAIEVLGLSQPRDEVAIKARTAYVSPDLSFASWGRVGRALDFVSGFYPDWDPARCRRLLEEFGLQRADRITSLSFGSRIKLSLVMALSREADLLLLDEPTVGLDVNARRQLFAEILAVMKREGRTVVISSHELADLERLADRVVVMARGAVVCEGRMDELIHRFAQVDALLTGAPPPLNGLRLIQRDQDRARLLVDRSRLDPDALASPSVQVLGVTPLSLEDLFVALASPVAAEAR